MLARWLLAWLVTYTGLGRTPYRGRRRGNGRRWWSRPGQRFNGPYGVAQILFLSGKTFEFRVNL